MFCLKGGLESDVRHDMKLMLSMEEEWAFVLFQWFELIGYRNGGFESFNIRYVKSKVVVSGSLCV